MKNEEKNIYPLKIEARVMMMAALLLLASLRRFVSVIVLVIALESIVSIAVHRAPAPIQWIKSFGARRSRRTR